MDQDSNAITQNAAASPNRVDPMVHTWFAQLLNIMDGNLDAETSRPILKECSLVHYRAIQMDEILAPYRGDLPGFIRFLEEKWYWKVDFDPERQVITADENKPDCVCPVVRQSAGPVPGVLCYCSEGFAERMFSTVLELPVRARVLRSVLRGDPTCVYQIQIL